MAVQQRQGRGTTAEVIQGEVAAELTVEEAGLRYLVQPLRNQNVGLFLDMAPTRRWLMGAAEGRKVLMVGDGLNDAPALASVHASMSPASAVDVAKVSAGLVFAGNGLDAVTTAHRAAQTARTRAFQSFAIAIVYNCIAIPLALAGMVTPLIAALAMSGSSVLVMLNAIRPEKST